MKKEDIKQIATNTANIDNIKEDIKEIKLQVTNHLPHQILALDQRMDKFDVKLGQMGIKMGLIISVIISVVNIAVQYFLNK